MVVGGGIAGIQAALDLVAVGLPVLLVEAGPSVGGLMAQLDKTFPTNDCAMCILSPRMLALARHPMIEILTLTEILQVQGRAGDFQVLLSQRPRYIDLNKCSCCGECMRVCPRQVPNPYNLGFTRTKAIHVPFAQAIPRAACISPASCLYLSGKRCEACVKVCAVGAIDFSQSTAVSQHQVGAIILATGANPASVQDFSGYSHADVVTSLEFERLLSATGPGAGKLVRPSDQTPPQRLAFIQCVGSRDLRLQVNYCSTICCMASLKQSLVAQEIAGSGLEATIFYMDVRAQGKGFERYLQQAQDKGVRLIRSRVSAVAGEAGNEPRVRYTDDHGHPQEEEFSMVVLAVGLRPPAFLPALTSRLRLDLNEHGFIQTLPLLPFQTQQTGLFIAGTAREPQDISETVTSASAAAAAVSQLLSLSDRTLALHDAPSAPTNYDQAITLIPKTEKQKPPTALARPDTSQLRIGVFLCHCGTNIAKNIDLARLAPLIRQIPGVVLVADEMFACSVESTRQLREAIPTFNLHRVVVAACSPLTHEALFREVVASAGLNPGYYLQVNIREQCSWVHQQQRDAALEKAYHLIEMAIARAKVTPPIFLQSFPVTPRALVLGGGVAGMSAALNLADQGFHTLIVEKTAQLGGLARQLHFTLEGADPQKFVQELEFLVYSHPNIEVLRRTELLKVEGYVGQFRTQVQQRTPSGPKMRLLHHGVIIVATGGKEFYPQGRYGYGADSRVLTQLELEAQISEENSDLAKVRRVVMIQCVGSREPEHPYCSRLCCAEALKNALLLKARYPDIEINVLYRDLRAYGFREGYYQQAKQKGVIFTPFQPQRPPRLEAPKGRPLQVWVWDDLLHQEVGLKADLVVLSAGIEPASGSLQLARQLGLARSLEGFFLEAHQKLRPVEMITEGIFLCGLAHYPKSLGETLSQAQAAAGRAGAILQQRELQHGELIARDHRGQCRGCLHCLKICPYGAIYLESGKPTIRTEVCHGCGICVAECPAQAIQLSRYCEAELEAQILALSYPSPG
jgi:heterodisulfide reductase subunit A